jgi:chemotaxis protein MotB
MANKRNAKKEKPSEARGIPAWMTTYTDLMTLMLSFFVILVSFATFEQGRIVKLVGSFAGAFKVLPGGYKTDPGDQVLEPGKEMIQSYRAPGDIFSKMKGVVEKSGAAGGIGFSQTSKGLELSIADYLLFGLESGKADIAPGMESFLDEMLEIMRQESYLIKIEGHTDDYPVASKQFPSSWELSTERAVTILRYFVEKGGISPLRLSAAGFGKYHPLYPNETSEDRAKNRRVVISLLRDELAQDGSEEGPLFKEGVVKPF